MYGQPIDMTTHVADDVYALAERYQIASLRALCHTYLRRTVTYETVWQR